MGYWNFRVLKKDNSLAIHSVYYNDEGKIVSWSLEPEFPNGDDIEELRTDLTLMLEATEKEIVDVEAIERESEN